MGAPQESVEDFLGAIESADQNLSWGLLSSDTKVTFQIDKQHWVEVLMPALKKVLESKVLPQGKTKEPIKGLLYFPMEKQKMKDLEIVYGGQENRIRLRFKAQSRS